MKINWSSKLTSRKFWVAVVGFVTPIMLAFNCSQSQITEATAIIMGGASLIAYIIGEGLVDSSRAKSETYSTSTITNITEHTQVQSVEDLESEHDVG